MEFTFKKEFEDKLNKLGVKEQFINNILNHDDDDNTRMLEKLNEEDTTWFRFIARAFTWYNSPEKQDFWEKIAETE